MVEVLWPDDDAWYKARVSDHKGALHELTYTADGVVEVIDLSKERFNVLTTGANGLVVSLSLLEHLYTEGES
jgi:hypothetical protein